jgi:hypothetical protein
MNQDVHATATHLGDLWDQLQQWAAVALAAIVGAGILTLLIMAVAG